MSRQLTISSLFSALAIVSLALFARAGAPVEMDGSRFGAIVHVQDVSDIAR